MDEVLQQCSDEYSALAENILGEERTPEAGLIPGSEAQIQLIPLTGGLCYVQKLIFPEGVLGDQSASERLFVGYTYSRGDSLGVIFGLPTTQEVLVNVSLLMQVDDDLVLLEERAGLGGEGCSGDQELVEKAVERLEKLEGYGEEVEQMIETVVSYAVGGTDLDSMRSLDAYLKTALLRAALRSQYWADKFTASSALHDMAWNQEPAVETVIPDLVAIAGDWNDKVSAEVVVTLSTFDPDIVSTDEMEDVSSLTRALKSELWERRAVAARLLGRLGLGAELAVPELLPLIEDESREVRMAAIWAIGETQSEDPETIQALILALEDQDPEVRALAAAVLGWCGSDALAATPFLIDMLEDDDAAVVYAAALALWRITGQEDLGMDPAAWRAWWDEQD